MASLLIQFAHPNLEQSRVHKKMLQSLAAVDGITINDLYERYPDFDIDIRREQQLLLQHDIVVLQHPLYWYSTPAIIKQWFDLVLEHGWAYGKEGTALRGKWMLSAISCGGSAEAYTPEGRNGHTMQQMLAPVAQTARLCGMAYLPPFVVYGTHRLQWPAIEQLGLQYAQLIHALANDKVQQHEWQAVASLNELCPIPEAILS